MDQFDVAVISSYHQDVLSAEWFFTIESLGKTCLLITPNPNEYYTLKKQGVKAAYLGHYFPEQIPDRAGIEKYFRERSVDDVVAYVATERSYYQQGNDHLIRYAYKYQVAFENLYSKIGIQTIIHPVQGGEVVRRTASMAANRASINVIYLGETFIPGTVNLYSDEYRTVLKPVVKRELPEEKAKQIIDDKINRKAVVHYVTERRKFIQTPLPVKILNLLKHGNWNILRAYVTRKKVLFYDYFVREMYTRAAGVFKDFNSNDKYFYLPFNVAAESEIFIRNARFADQAVTVEKLAKGLPPGYKLYVKIHPGIEGHLSIDEYKRLVKIKNVVPLKGSVNSYDVVKNSAGVVMVSSTVGLESYIMGKPTCIIGHWPYTQYGDFVTVDKLEDAFTKMLEKKTPNKPVEFIQNIYRETVDGGLYTNADDFRTLMNSIFTMTYLRDLKSNVERK
jgi:capsule polysaccharide modification protein KpsS